MNQRLTAKRHRNVNMNLTVMAECRRNVSVNLLTMTVKGKRNVNDWLSLPITANKKYFQQIVRMSIFDSKVEAGYCCEFFISF